MIGLSAAGTSYVGNMGDNCLACAGRPRTTGSAS